jgi:hypothetical protein
MKDNHFEANLRHYSQWRGQLIEAIEKYQHWRKRYKLDDPNSTANITGILENLNIDRLTLAFVAEFSRGKTELINALFFSDTGVRLLPSMPGRTTMCPTEFFYDEENGSYLRLLDINSRFEDIPLNELKQDQKRWLHIDLDCAAPKQMQAAFKELLAVKRVPKHEAIKLGLYDEREAIKWGIGHDNEIDIPRWRHALISFPHPLFKQGLTILDTPGLNALGSEPELTINMLPSAHAVVFVIAADTGVTKSDLDIWCSHVNKVGKQGLAVVFNKIDTMWDDILSSDEEYRVALDSQVTSAANILKIDSKYIFPLSAKQALIAKVKGDQALLDKSGIAAIETYLSSGIVQHWQALLMDTIVRDIGFLITESINLTDIKYSQAAKEFQEFKQLDIENRELINKLIKDTLDLQDKYSADLTAFKQNRKKFEALRQALLDSISPVKIDKLIKYSKNEMSNSLSTHGMRQCMQKLFDDLRYALQSSVRLTLDTQDMVKTIHNQFHQDFGFKEIEPRLFTIDRYQFELEQLLADFNAYRLSSRVAITDQKSVVEQLYSTTILKAKKIIKRANKDATLWSRNALSPLLHQIASYKKQTEIRLSILNSLLESKDNLQENLNKLDKELKAIVTERTELNEIVNSIVGDFPLLIKSGVSVEVPAEILSRYAPWWA